METKKCEFCEEPIERDFLCVTASGDQCWHFDCAKHDGIIEEHIDIVLVGRPYKSGRKLCKCCGEKVDIDAPHIMMEETRELYHVSCAEQEGLFSGIQFCTP